MDTVPTRPEDFPEGYPYVDLATIDDDEWIMEPDPVLNHPWPPTEPYYALRIDSIAGRVVLHYYHGTKYDNAPKAVQDGIVESHRHGSLGFMEDWKWDIRRKFNLPAARIGLAYPEPWDERSDEALQFYVLWLSGPNFPATKSRMRDLAEQCGLDETYIVTAYCIN